MHILPFPYIYVHSYVFLPRYANVINAITLQNESACRRGEMETRL